MIDFSLFPQPHPEDATDEIIVGLLRQINHPEARVLVGGEAYSIYMPHTKGVDVPIYMGTLSETRAFLYGVVHGFIHISAERGASGAIPIREKE